LTLAEHNRNIRGMSASAEKPMPPAADLEAAADQAIAACGGGAREALKARIVANGFPVAQQVEKLKAAVSTCCARRRIDIPLTECKDWYD